MTDPDNSPNNLLNGSATSSVRRDGNAGLSRGGSGNYDRRQPDQTRFVPSLRNSFPQRNRYRETEAEGYAHDCLPLGLRESNVMTMSQNPNKIRTLSTKSNGCNNGRALRAGNLLGNSGHNARSFATSRSDLLCEVKEESSNVTHGTSNQIGQMSSPSLQALNLCTFTPGRNCPDSRWAQPVHNRLMTPVVSPYNQFSAASDAPNMIAHTQIINPSGSHMTNHNHNEFDTKRDHLFKEPSLPRHPDWSHFKTVPSIAPSTFNESDNASQSIPLTCSAASHCNTCSNPSYFQGNDIESCPSRLTSPMHSAYSRKTRKRALSISPFLSEGLDLNSIIRLSPTSLFTCLLSRHSSTSGSPQPVQQGSFSHLTARNTSPYSQHGSGHRGFGENTAPFSTELSENNLMEEIMRNAFVATKDDMPYFEQNYYSWNIHDDSAGIQNRPANGYQKCCCVTYANSQVGNVTSAAQSNCTVSGRTDSFLSSTNEAMGRHNNSGICIANAEPPVSFSCGAHHQRRPHCIHQTHTHNHYLQQQQHHMACKSPSQAAFPSSCHVQQRQQQLKAEPSALEVYNLDEFDQMAISCVDRHMPASSHVVDSFSPGELQQVNGLSMDSADSSIPSINMDNVFSYEDSTQREGSVAGHGECDGDGPMICRWKDCNLMFGNQRELVVHLKMHVDQTTDDEFTCLWENCKRNCDPFNARYKLVIHLRVHSKEQPHKCMTDGCTKAFSRLENLKIHLRSHTGERPYVCEHPGCRRAFSNSSDRAKHKKTHIDTRPYVCQTSGCGKRYTDPSSLRKHAKSHSREQQQQQQQQHQQSQKQHHQQSRKQHHQQSQQKKKLKKETQGGGDIFNTCLSIQKLKPGGASTERSDLVTSPHTGSNNDIFQSLGLPRSVSSQCGTVSATSNMSIQQSPGTLEVLEEASESMPLNSASGFSSALSPLTLPPIPHQMRPSASGVYGGKYGTNHEMFPLSQVTALPPITQQLQQQQLIPHYPQNFTSFNGCRVSAMQAQRMMQFPGFHPEAFLPVNGLEPSGFSDASSFATLEALGAPNEVSMQEYLQLSAIDRGNSHTSIYADGST